jgi:ABC-type cobalamin/Fe3+-siderophores transport system ATPase subunit
MPSAAFAWKDEGMEVQIRHIDIELKNYRCFARERPARFRIGRQFTGFVGANNAGKSTLLRFFYELRHPFQLMASASGNFLELLRMGQGINFAAVSDPAEIFSNQNDGAMEIRFEIALEGVDEDVPVGEQPLPIPKWLLLRLGRDRTLRVEAEGLEFERATAVLEWHEKVLLVQSVPTAEFSPWMTVFDGLSRSIFIPAFRNAVNAGAGAYYDLQVGSGFVQEWDLYKSGPTKANNLAALQLTSEIKRIFGFEELDINASQGNDTLQVIIDGRSYRLDEIGGGIAHFIMVLAYAATRRPPYVFIDEPELNLHPSLQLDFLTTLANYAEEGVIFATHSIGLARAGAETLYSVRRLRSGESEVREFEGTPRLPEFLGELSFSGYQELGFDKVLLVEGSTDVKVFQRLLRLYRAEHEVVLLPLGGSTMIHRQSADELGEIKRITQNVFAIVDSEKAEQGVDLPPERAAFQEACREADITCIILERRAVENYFTDRAVKAALGQAYSALEPYEALRETDPTWPKSDNWRIAGNIERAELANTDLGAALELVVA